jgi:hypothetical protein
MKIRGLLFIVSIMACGAFMSSGCKDKDRYKKELAGLDSMEGIVSRISGTTQTVDSSVVLSTCEQVLNDLGQADTLLPDTLKDKGLAILLMDYRSVTTPLKQYPYKMKELHTAAVALGTRLAHLRNDLVKEVADEKLVGTYMEREKENTRNLEQSYALLEAVKNKNLAKADSLSTLVKSKIQELVILKAQRNKK